jgi:heterodisulfide reductase subunit A
MTEGIYIAGCVQGPKDIPATVAQGAAAAARVLGKIQQKEMALEPIRASVIEEQCSGCRICNGMCINAITFHEDRMVSRSIRALPGCGTCACPQVRSPVRFSNGRSWPRSTALAAQRDGSEAVPAMVNHEWYL